MTNYEFTFLLARDEKEELKEIEQLFLDLKAKIRKKTSWGNKELSYRIKKSLSAFYYHWSVTMPHDKVAQLKKKLGYQTKLLRYLLLKTDEPEEELKEKKSQPIKS